MKKILMMLAAVLTAAVTMFTTGCTSELPTVEKISAVAKAVGYTAGYACELSKTKTEVKESIAAVLDAAALVTPAVDQTFADAWAPIVEKTVQQLVADKKIPTEYTGLVTTAMTAATTGLDFIFKKYPQAKSVQDLVSATVANFVAGYKSVVTLQAGQNAAVEIDKEALEAINAVIKK